MMKCFELLWHKILNSVLLENRIFCNAIILTESP